ncbi:MAG TPA: hypothetical protein QF564_29715 [Pirellulaceae bacterium]|nr:hypothetical protein [Pirellulaceae bacterium]
MDSGLEITTWAAAADQPTVFVFPVSDLINGKGVGAGDSDSLHELIISTVSPDSWSDGNNPDAFPFAGSLVIPQLHDIGETIGNLITTLRQVKESETETAHIKQISYCLDREGRARSILKQRISIAKQTLTLGAAIAELGRVGEFNARIDALAIEDQLIDDNQLIELEARSEPVSRVVTRLTSSLRLTWTYQDDVLLVTTDEQALPVIRVYPVHDLVARPSAGSDRMLDNPFNWSVRAADDSADSLVTAISGTIDVDDWDSVGGLFSIEALDVPRVLVVRQTRQVHEEIADLLTRFRQSKRKEDKASKDPVDDKLAVRLERIYLAADVPAPRVAKLMRELFPDCRFIKPIGQSLLVRDVESNLLEIFSTLHRVGLVDSRRMENPIGGGDFFDQDEMQ